MSKRKQFRLYNVTVEIAGSAGMATPKLRVTAPEIALLAAIHGQDAIIPRSIVWLRDQYVAKDPFELREELAEKYRTPNVDGAKLLAMTFGALGELPTHVEDVLPGLGEENITRQQTADETEALKSLMAENSTRVSDHEGDNAGIGDALSED